jgi:acyl-CoA synthetase (AMP-forming)/AMP-acid ligase II
MGSQEAQVTKIEGLLERLGGRFVMASEHFHREAERLQAAAVLDVTIDPGILAGAALAGPGSGKVHIPSAGPEDTAFLQLTSGSTGHPRAVMIPHRAAIHNSIASDVAIGTPYGKPAREWATSMVSWLPLHHDMGLVGCLLLSVVCGLDLWLLPPSTFLARPRLWLEHLGQHGPAFAPAPNFGYQLCLERLSAEKRQGLDLSGWRSAMTGAEMIRPETTSAFCDSFAPFGFRPEAFRPCYGLAEATLAATFDLKGEGVRTLPLPPGAANGLGLSDVVCVGQPLIDTEVHITAPDGSPLPEGGIGEIRIHGPGVFAGYFGDPEATADGLRSGWLLTGDLGFLHDGELYLTGRTKDLLILRGHNMMPHELEWLAEEVTGGGGAMRCGAFSIAHGGEGEVPVLVVEVTDRKPASLAALNKEIRSQVGRALSLPLADLVFIRRGRIPKTTSGKVQRRQLRQSYLEGTLERLDF